MEGASDVVFFFFVGSPCSVSYLACMHACVQIDMGAVDDMQVQIGTPHAAPLHIYCDIWGLDQTAG